MASILKKLLENEDDEFSWPSESSTSTSSSSSSTSSSLVSESFESSYASTYDANEDSFHDRNEGILQTKHKLSSIPIPTKFQYSPDASTSASTSTSTTTTTVSSSLPSPKNLLVQRRQISTTATATPTAARMDSDDTYYYAIQGEQACIQTIESGETEIYIHNTHSSLPSLLDESGRLDDDNNFYDDDDDHHMETHVVKKQVKQNINGEGGGCDDNMNDTNNSHRKSDKNPSPPYSPPPPPPPPPTPPPQSIHNDSSNIIQKFWEEVDDNISTSIHHIDDELLHQHDENKSLSNAKTKKDMLNHRSDTRMNLSNFNECEVQEQMVPPPPPPPPPPAPPSNIPNPIEANTNTNTNTNTSTNSSSILISAQATDTASIELIVSDTDADSLTYSLNTSSTTSPSEAVLLMEAMSLPSLLVNDLDSNMKNKTDDTTTNNGHNDGYDYEEEEEEEDTLFADLTQQSYEVTNTIFNQRRDEEKDGEEELEEDSIEQFFMSNLHTSDTFSKTNHHKQQDLQEEDEHNDDHDGAADDDDLIWTHPHDGSSVDVMLKDLAWAHPHDGSLENFQFPNDSNDLGLHTSLTLEQQRHDKKSSHPKKENDQLVVSSTNQEESNAMHMIPNKSTVDPNEHTISLNDESLNNNPSTVSQKKTNQSNHDPTIPQLQSRTELSVPKSCSSIFSQISTSQQDDSSSHTKIALSISNPKNVLVLYPAVQNRSAPDLTKFSRNDFDDESTSSSSSSSNQLSSSSLVPPNPQYLVDPVGALTDQKDNISEDEDMNLQEPSTTPLVPAPVPTTAPSQLQLLAVIRIQRWFRNIHQRLTRKYLEQRKQYDSAVQIQSMIRGRSCRHAILTKMGVAKRLKWEPRTKTEKITVLHSKIRRTGRAFLRSRPELQTSLIFAIRRVCAIKIQSSIRKCLLRRKVYETGGVVWAVRRFCAMKIQHWCRLQFNVRLKRIRHDAAIVIQTIARRYMDRKDTVYKQQILKRNARETSAILIQTWARTCIQRNRYLHHCEDLVCVKNDNNVHRLKQHEEKKENEIDRLKLGGMDSNLFPNVSSNQCNAKNVQLEKMKSLDSKELIINSCRNEGSPDEPFCNVQLENRMSHTKISVRGGQTNHWCPPEKNVHPLKGKLINDSVQKSNDQFLASSWDKFQMSEEENSDSEDMSSTSLLSVFRRKGQRIASKLDGFRKQRNKKKNKFHSEKMLKTSNKTANKDIAASHRASLSGPTKQESRVLFPRRNINRKNKSGKGKTLLSRPRKKEMKKNTNEGSMKEFSFNLGDGEETDKLFSSNFKEIAKHDEASVSSNSTDDKSVENHVHTSQVSYMALDDDDDDDDNNDNNDNVEEDNNSFDRVEHENERHIVRPEFVFDPFHIVHGSEVEYQSKTSCKLKTNNLYVSRSEMSSSMETFRDKSTDSLDNQNDLSDQSEHFVKYSLSSPPTSQYQTSLKNRNIFEDVFGEDNDDNDANSSLYGNGLKIQRKWSQVTPAGHDTSSTLTQSMSWDNAQRSHLKRKEKKKRLSMESFTGSLVTHSADESETNVTFIEYPQSNEKRVQKNGWTLYDFENEINIEPELSQVTPTGHFTSSKLTQSVSWESMQLMQNERNKIQGKESSTGSLLTRSVDESDHNHSSLTSYIHTNEINKEREVLQVTPTGHETSGTLTQSTSWDNAQSSYLKRKEREKRQSEESFSGNLSSFNFENEVNMEPDPSRARPKGHYTTSKLTQSVSWDNMQSLSLTRKVRNKVQDEESFTGSFSMHSVDESEANLSVFKTKKPDGRNHNHSSLKSYIHTNVINKEREISQVTPTRYDTSSKLTQSTSWDTAQSSVLKQKERNEKQSEESFNGSLVARSVDESEIHEQENGWSSYDLGNELNVESESSQVTPIGHYTTSKLTQSVSWDNMQSISSTRKERNKIQGKESSTGSLLTHSVDESEASVSVFKNNHNHSSLTSCIHTNETNKEREMLQVTPTRHDTSSKLTQSTSWDNAQSSYLKQKERKKRQSEESFSGSLAAHSADERDRHPAFIEDEADSMNFRLYRKDVETSPLKKILARSPPHVEVDILAKFSRDIRLQEEDDNMKEEFF